MTTYKILHNNVPVKNKPTFFASTIGRLKKGTKIKVTSINGIWANFKFKNKSAYILTFYLKKVEIITTGSIKIKYLNVDTNEEIAPYVTHDSLELKSYSYTAPALDNYTVIEPSNISITLSSSNPKQEVKFYYKENKVYGSVTIKYIDTDTQLEISSTDIYSNLTIGSYTYKAKSIDGYTLISDDTQKVTLTDNNYNQIVLFKYKVNKETKPTEPYDDTKVPYIATKYLETTFDINEDIIINLYVSDWDQSDAVYEDTDTKFTLYMYVNEIYKEFNIFIGDNSINIGKLDEGNYELLLQICDIYGRKSHQLYNEFRVINKEVYNKLISENTYTVTDNDLLKYDIDKNNNEKKAYETKIGIQSMINDLAKSGVRKAILQKGEYVIKVENTWSPGNQIEYVKDPIFIPSNFILDLNKSTIKSNPTPYEQNTGMMMSIDHAYDAHVINGVLEGDYGRRDLTPLGNGNPSAEHLSCARIS